MRPLETLKNSASAAQVRIHVTECVRPPLHGTDCNVARGTTAVDSS